MMEQIAMANFTSELAYRFSLSTYPTTRETITRGRRSEVGVKDDSRYSLDTNQHTRHTFKDIDGKHVDPINGVFVVVQV